MTLATGVRLGPYEILAPLGAGGMGEVYKARDTRLGREVAVKVLSSAVASDSEHLRRFEQEARSASALSDPHIVTVFDVGEQGGIHYFASELVEGGDLRSRLGSSGLPIRKAIEIAEQIASGLASAHEKGITHRDLKPENILLTRSGLAKIADFGLAKLAETPESELSQMPTADRIETTEGVVMGTVSYMSPEQAAGRKIDYRSDQFSFGLVLYEMLTGKQAFKKETKAETLASILRDDPQPVAGLNPSVPAPLSWVVERCLAKDPDERYASTRDMSRDLARLRESLTQGMLSGKSPAPPAPSKSAPRAPAALLLLLAVAAAGAVASRLFWPSPPPPAPSFHQLTFRKGWIGAARFAPDGQTVVYSAAWDGDPLRLFSARPESPEFRSLGLPDADLFSISKSGEMAISLASTVGSEFFFAGTLARVPLAGGAPREVLRDAASADWSPDGSLLAVVRNIGGKSRIECPVGKVLYETPGSIDLVRFAPSGDSIAFTEHPLPGDQLGTVGLVDLSGKVRRLTGSWSGVFSLAWSASGKEVWFTAGQLGWNFPIRAVDLSGRQRVIAQFPDLAQILDVAGNGKVLFKRGSLRGAMVCRASGEAMERDLYWLDGSFATDLSADGKTILFGEGGEASGSDFSAYVRKTDGSPAVFLGKGNPSALSPDGKWAIALSHGMPAQFALLPTGVGEARAVTHDSINHYRARFFPDGKRILFSGSEPGRGVRLYVQSLEGGAAKGITPEGIDRREFEPSPDGLRVAAIDSNGEVRLYPVSGGEAASIPNLPGGRRPIRWSGEGKALFLARVEPGSTKISRIDVATGREQVIWDLKPPDPTGVVVLLTPRITRDGSSYVYSYFRDQSDLFLAEGLK